MNKLRILIFALLCINGSAFHASTAHRITSAKPNASDLPENIEAAVTEITKRHKQYRHKIMTKITYIPSRLEKECSAKTKDSIQQRSEFETIRQHNEGLLDNFSFMTYVIVTQNVTDTTKVDIASCNCSTDMQATFDK